MNIENLCIYAAKNCLVPSMYHVPTDKKIRQNHTVEVGEANNTSCLKGRNKTRTLPLGPFSLMWSEDGNSDNRL